jgi:Ras-related protein Rab-6A
MINNLESTSMCDIKYKIVFLGSMSVGKSSIIERFTYGNFDDNHQDTVGIDFLSKNHHYNGHLYRLLLWDTAGQEKFRSLIPAYLRDAHCAVFVYDVTCSQSFSDLP